MWNKLNFIEIILLLTFLIIVSCIDIVKMYVNVIFCLCFGAVGVLYEIISKNRGILDVIIGVVPGIIVLLISLATREGIGKGDALIIIITGIFLGMVNNCKVLIYALFSTVILGFILLILLKKGRKYKIPFIPFILSGYLIFMIGV